MFTEKTVISIFPNTKLKNLSATLIKIGKTSYYTLSDRPRAYQVFRYVDDQGKAQSDEEERHLNDKEDHANELEAKFLKSPYLSEAFERMRGLRQGHERVYATGRIVKLAVLLHI